MFAIKGHLETTSLLSQAKVCIHPIRQTLRSLESFNGIQVNSALWSGFWETTSLLSQAKVLGTSCIIYASVHKIGLTSMLPALSIFS